ncbi:phospholipase D-like domain-containing protein [Actinoplanes sp. KI2]|uniref:phospholipase D-like domain-containing protein n=1 Tax=Actinoplanes sp. KI2 TaxID=2983315 RepID=UPI0021D5B99C|nr:phospholipase D-like domain-containing protein [Actinoplanes sp. KI2]MCU7729119.1 phospholipase D-like domain-containing protein [Actinoplanes sp. KI2]
MRHTARHTLLCAGVAALLAPASAGAVTVAASTYTLLTQPGSGHSALYRLINNATTSINLTMYELNDATATADLAAAQARGVTVRVILDGKQTSVNSTAYTYLKNHGVGVVHSSSAYYYTHEKSMVVDGATAVVMSENWTPAYYSADRNFDLIENDAADVAAMQAVFNADYAKSSITPSDGDDLVWSPTDAQSRLLALINGATTSLSLYALEMDSTPIVNALVSAAGRGVTVKIVAEYNSAYAAAYHRLKAAGAGIVTYGTSDALYIHAKAIVADYGTSAAKVYVGSQNFTGTSLNANRELGLIISNGAVLASVNSTLATDFADGTAW